MRIKKVRIRNFRCLEDVAISFENVTTLIGPNGTGKSTILRALDWFFNGTPKGAELSDRDVTHGVKTKTISVEVHFDELTTEDRMALSGVMAGVSDQLTVRKYRDPDGTERMTADGKTYHHFGQVRRGRTASDRRREYNSLRGDFPELELPEVRSDASIKEALGQWESAHPGELSLSELEVADLFGFTTQGVMSGLFDFVLVTADLRASEEVQDAKTTIIGRILEKAISHEETRDEVALLEKETKSKLRKIHDSSFRADLEAISQQLTASLSIYTKDRTVSIESSEIDFRLPRRQFAVSIRDAAVETPITRQGHGFQRALLISSLQLLAKRINASGEHTGTICLALEEPELFQHPTQAITFATALRKLADDRGKGIQVTYATHSPYFIQAEHFDDIRRVTRRFDGQSKQYMVTVKHASINAIQERLLGQIHPDKVSKRAGKACLGELPESLFAHAGLLVEGATEKAIFEGVAERGEGTPLGVSGVAVSMVGKDGRLQHAILTELGIPCYIVFDGDEAKSGTKNHRNTAGLNKAITKYLTGKEEEWPRTDANQKYAVFADTLEPYLECEWPAWEIARKEACSAGLGYDGKDPLAYRHAALNASENPPEMILTIVNSVRALAKHETDSMFDENTAQNEKLAESSSVQI